MLGIQGGVAEAEAFVLVFLQHFMISKDDDLLAGNGRFCDLGDDCGADTRSFDIENPTSLVCLKLRE